MFYMSCVLETNVLIALNKLIDSKSISGVMLLPPRPTPCWPGLLKLRMLNATYGTQHLPGLWCPAGLDPFAHVQDT